jgi:glycosidase
MMYLLMPDRFANGTTTVKTQPKKNTTELPGGRHGGDIEGIIKRKRTKTPPTTFFVNGDDC